MAMRPAWKGYLKLSLVTCAVEIFNATTHTEKVSFRVLNRATGNTVRRQYVDSVTGKPVEEGDEVKGYELGDDNYLPIEEKDIDAVEIESNHTLNLEGFIDKSGIDPIYLDTPYFLAPADKVSLEAFAVVRDALAARKMAGVARIVLYRRERPVLIEARDGGMLLTTLRYARQVRKPDEIFNGIDKVDIDQEMIDLASHIIDRKKTKFDPSKFDDKYEDALLELIEARKAGKKAPAGKVAPKPSNVVDLFDALKRSLNPGSDADKPAKAGKPLKAGKKPSRAAPASKAEPGKAPRRKSA